MRKLGQELGVEAMALYRHVRNKDDILDGAIDALELGVIADQLQIQRLKKRKLSLRDRISYLEDQITPDIIA